MPDDTAPTTPPPAALAPPSGSSGATMPAASDPDPRHELIAAAERAALTGDRSALLTYMRLKRSFA